jgi:O-antigen ligase
MGLFARRKIIGQGTDAPLSRGLIIGMLGLIAVLGYVVQAEVELPPWILGLVGAGGLLALLFIGLGRPDVPVYVLVAYVPFSKLLTGDFGGIMTALNLTNLLLAIVLITWFAAGTTRGSRFFEPHPLHVPVGLFAFWGVLSFLVIAFKFTWTGWYVSTYIDELKRWLDPLLIYFLFFHLVRDKQRWKNVVIILMIGVAIVALMAVHDYMGVRAGTSLNKARVSGIAGQPNILGAFFVYYMFLFAGFWLERIRRPRAWWFLVPFLLCFRGIMVTFSRGAYLAFAQGVLGLTFFKNKLFFFLAVGALAFVVLHPSILPPGIRYRLDSTFRPDTQLTDAYGTGGVASELDKSSAVRLVVWQGALQLIGQEPVLGVGFGRFQDRIREFTGDKYIDAHNAYLIMAAEMGLPALFFFLLIIGMLFRITSVVFRRHPDPFVRATALGFLGGLSGLLMANMFGSRINTTEVSGYFWILAALMARAHAWVREEQRAARATARTAAARRRRAPAAVSPAWRRAA